MYPNFEKIYAPVLSGKENLSRSEIQVLCCFHQEKTASLCVNTQSGLYHCKGCGEKGSAIGFYMKNRGVDYKTALKELGEFNENYKPVKYIKPPKPEHIDTDYTDYIVKTVSCSILNEKHFEFYGKKLFELRGLTYNTAVSCGIGYDPSKGWILPIIRYPTGKCVGYEVRKKDFTKFNGGNKCYKAENSPSCLSMTYLPAKDSKKAFICEGFMDSYFLYQYLAEKNNGIVEDTILTPSMGVGTVLELVDGLWNEFDEIIFILDNDKASKPITELVSKLEHNGKFKFFSGLDEDDDFENFYKRVKS